MFSDCVSTNHRMLVAGAEIGLSTAYFCTLEAEGGCLARILPE